MKVFISHKTEERNEYEEIARVLRTQDIEPWDPLSLASGRSLPDELQRASRACEACIFIATPASVDSSWCHAEVGAFWGRGKRVYVFKPDASLDDQRLPAQLRHTIWAGDHLRLVLQIIKDFRRTRRERMLLSAVICAALMVAVVTWFAWPYDKPPPNPLKTPVQIEPRSELPGNMLIPTVPVESKEIAVFRNQYPRNRFDQEWQIFSDSKWGGKSTIWYTMEPHDQMEAHEKLGGYYMSIHFKIIDPHLTFDRSGMGYCGVYTEFSSPPAGMVNLSAYEGIEFYARYKPKKPEDSSAVEFFLQVAIYKRPEYIKDYGYHEKRFPLTSNAANFKRRGIKFSELQTPAWSSTSDFDKTKIFRIALVIKSRRPAEGYLHFDGLRLFETGDNHEPMAGDQLLDLGH
jgi:TIR domain